MHLIQDSAVLPVLTLILVAGLLALLARGFLSILQHGPSRRARRALEEAGRLRADGRRQLAEASASARAMLERAQRQAEAIEAQSRAQARTGVEAVANQARQALDREIRDQLDSLKRAAGPK